MSSRIKKFERRIAKSKDKLKKYSEKIKYYTYRIGITSPTEFQLIDKYPMKKIFPCNIGILFCGNFLKRYYEKFVVHLELVYDSFFFNIIDLGHYRFSKKLMKKGVKKEKYNSMKIISSERLSLHPTNKFFQVLIDKRIENNLDMIVAITKLPIYSSSNNNIIFLFGEANIDHGCSIVSTLLLKEQFYKRKRNRSLYELRIQKELIHEVGHLIFGPVHCKNRKCVMSFAKNVSDIDTKYIGLCLECQEKLETLKVSYNF
ncbi:MAG: hypothetical protein ACFFBP_10075 [Promethearchaeota archaeon]